MPANSAWKVLLVTATIFIGATAATHDASAAKELYSRPYKATIEGVADGFPCGIYSASGKATHLGKVVEFGSYCAGTPTELGLTPLVGEGTQVAENGDTLTYTFQELVDFSTDPFTAAGTFTITGGTGRFSGATGGGTFATTGTFLEGGRLGLSIEFDGTITY